MELCTVGSIVGVVVAALSGLGTLYINKKFSAEGIAKDEEIKALKARVAECEKNHAK